MGRSSRWLIALAVGLTGCGRTTSPTSSMASGGTSAGGSSGGGENTSGTGWGGTIIVDPPVCTDEQPAAAPIRLLDDRQLSHVAELFGESVETAWPPATSSLYAVELPPASPAVVERQLELASRIARRAVTEPALFERVVGCDFEAEGADACLPALKQFVLTRLFRGLAPEGTDEDLDAIYERGASLGGDDVSGLRAVLEVALQSPELMYRVEVGQSSDNPNGWDEPTPREMASRLSFLLWDRGPDDELLAAADADELTEAEQLADQARRLLQDERAHDVVRRFYEELMLVGYAGTNNSLVPELTPSVYAAMRNELAAFVVDATFNGPGSFAALFAPTTWVDASLARFYGFPAPSGAGYQRLELDGARYAGLLTQAAWLVGTNRDSTSPTQRGLTVARALLCREVPPEPPDLEVTLEVPSPLPLTTRQRLEEHVANPACRACHQAMDPYGLALEHFDHLGRWRELEHGQPIDTAVELLEGARIDGSAELAAWLLENPETRDCFVRNWRAFAFGRARASAESCEQQELLGRFLSADENVVELLVALTQTKTFRYLGKSQP